MAEEGLAKLPELNIAQWIYTYKIILVGQCELLDTFRAHYRPQNSEIIISPQIICSICHIEPYGQSSPNMCVTRGLIINRLGVAGAVL